MSKVSKEVQNGLISFDTSNIHTSFAVLIVLTVLIGKYIHTFLSKAHNKC